jgi:hypothetical protein
MAPKYKPSSGDPDSWWKNAYRGHPDITVEYEYVFGKDTILPNMRFKIKNKRGEFKFRCVAHNAALNTTWIDCMDTDTGEWRSFYPDQIRGVVKPRKRRTKKSG